MINALIPQGVQDLQRETKQCHDARHKHKNPTIQRVTFSLHGVNVDIESECGSFRYNIRAGKDAIFGATAGSARAWLNKHCKKIDMSAAEILRREG
jgi:hypothetical protein